MPVVILTFILQVFLICNCHDLCSFLLILAVTCTFNLAYKIYDAITLDKGKLSAKHLI